MIKYFLFYKFLGNLKTGTFFKSTGGRNNSGVITAFHRGGRKKVLYRCLDFCGKLILVEVFFR